jgi:hypothetical protein
MTTFIHRLHLILVRSSLGVTTEDSRLGGPRATRSCLIGADEVVLDSLVPFIGSDEIVFNSLVPFISSNKVVLDSLVPFLSSNKIILNHLITLVRPNEIIFNRLPLQNQH